MEFVLQTQYDLDYSKAKPNRFAAKGGRVVVLEPEVAAAFRQSDDVNAVLRALLHTMPGAPKSGATPQSQAAPADQTPA